MDRVKRRCIKQHLCRQRFRISIQSWLTKVKAPSSACHVTKAGWFCDSIAILLGSARSKLKQWGDSFFPSSPDVPSCYDAEIQRGDNIPRNPLEDFCSCANIAATVAAEGELGK